MQSQNDSYSQQKIRRRESRERYGKLNQQEVFDSAKGTQRQSTPSECTQVVATAPAAAGFAAAVGEAAASAADSVLLCACLFA